ncbi:succinate dehydrogenase, cytochrome b556 subunit [Desulfurobacterium atlanticum]|uniref:Succinate dehydrogenase subunit C n=1 Tax=Desulfurobacterium atlanticum TaxID=240169 RepID=A0A238Y828_9BACT|nr:hypothetical protein [Desulfurobacterium atlanticum]SNR67247.1 hypothetical protein SAMN06265340_102196 [Desulfurobacterium atlanticum]
MVMEEKLSKLHRITGVFLFVYMVIHVLAKGPVCVYFDWLAVVAFAYHAFNGIRLIILELAFFIGKPGFIEYPYSPVSLKYSRILFYICMAMAAVFLLVLIIGKGMTS